jgi:hypothetical protein
VSLELVEADPPHLAVGLEPRIQLEQGLRSQPVQPALAIRSYVDQAGLAKHPQVLRDGRLAGTEHVDQRPDGLLALPEDVEDLAAVRLGENLEDGGHPGSML